MSTSFFSNRNVYGDIYTFNNFINKLSHNTCHDKFMYLKLFVDDTPYTDASSNSDIFRNDIIRDLKMIYINSAREHNQKIIDDPHFFDAGFDIFLPFNTRFITGQVNKVDFKVKCCAKIFHLDENPESFTRSYFTGFYTHPRSSLSKTPLRLANSTGIIDAGYRGNLIGMFDCFYNSDTSNDSNSNSTSSSNSNSTSSSNSRNENYCSAQSTRLLQICAPSLMPIFVEIVDTIEDLGPSTSRGAGGIGSTGA
jgi:dUTPase